MDSTSAVMMALAEAPTLVGSVRNFDPTARLLIACRWPSANAVLDETSLGGARNRLESSQVARSHSVSFRLIPSHSVSFRLIRSGSLPLRPACAVALCRAVPGETSLGSARNRWQSSQVALSHSVSFGLIWSHSGSFGLAPSRSVGLASLLGLAFFDPSRRINNQTTRRGLPATTPSFATNKAHRATRSLRTYTGVALPPGQRC